MEEDQEDMSPFWQPTSRRHRRPWLPSSGFLLVLLLSLAVLFIFIIIRSFLSFTSQVLKPQTVKKGWDSLNLVLVLFAIICGFLSRNGGGEENRKNPFEEDHYRGLSRSQDSFRRSYSSPRTPQRFWMDQDLSGSIRSYNNGRLNRLRSFSSYPDLRQHLVEEEDQEGSSWGYQWRFYDDTHLYNYHSSSLDQQTVLAPPQTEEKRGGKEEDGGGGGDDVKDVSVDVDSTSFVSEKEIEKEVVHYTAAETVEEEALPTEVLESPPLPPPHKAVRRRVRRTYEDVGKSEGRKKNDLGESTSNSPPPPPPRPPPSPPSPTSYTAAFEESGKSEKKRSSASVTKEFLNSLKRKKKKKQRQKSVENLDSFFNYESSYTLPTTHPPSPPPPPPPPPPPFFQSFFSSKKRKTKKIHTIQSCQSSPPPPPPPPPRRQPPRTQQLSRKTAVENTAYTTTQKPPIPVKIRSYNNMVEENTNSGGESPMNAIPPPPPLPPFNIPVWKFEVHGDYVRLKSNNDIDVDETGSPYSDGGGGTAADGGDAVAPPLFCPSPDVDMKADDFIKKFRDGLRLEKMNSVKEKEGRVGRSNLGPRLEPGPT